MNHTSHNITNVLVSTRDDTATSEAYFMAYHSVPGESRDVDWIAAGRYLDRFERREGLWKIAGRRVVYDWMQRAPSRSDWEESPLKDMLIRGRRGFDDPVYHV